MPFQDLEFHPVYCCTYTKIHIQANADTINSTRLVPLVFSYDRLDHPALTSDISFVVEEEDADSEDLKERILLGSVVSQVWRKCNPQARWSEQFYDKDCLCRFLVVSYYTCKRLSLQHDSHNLRDYFFPGESTALTLVSQRILQLFNKLNVVLLGSLSAQVLLVHLLPCLVLGLAL